MKAVSSAYPPALLLSAVGVAVQAGEHSPGGHELTGLIPAVSVAKTRRVSLAFAVQDRVQPVRLRVKRQLLLLYCHFLPVTR